jgi:hypothetical protein
MTQSPRQAVTTRQWIRGLIYPDAAVQSFALGTGRRLPCLGCSGSHDKLQDLDRLQNTSGLSGPMMSVRLRDKLSVSVYATRRGANSEHTRALGRTGIYDCLVWLFNLYYRRDFCIIVIHFATLIHFQDKTGKKKSTMVLTNIGYKVARTRPRR